MIIGDILSQMFRAELTANTYYEDAHRRYLNGYLLPYLNFGILKHTFAAHTHVERHTRLHI